MAESVVSFLLDSITKLLVEEAKFLSGVSDEAEKLHLELMTTQAFLRDADERQHEAAIIKELVSQCKYLAYEAENILEDYAFKLGSRKQKKGTFSIVKRYACILNEFRIQHNVGVEIQSLNSRISDLTRRFQILSIVAVTEGKGSNSRQQLQQLRMTYPYVASDEDFVGFGDDVEKFVGFGDDVEKLVEALVNEDNTHGVVSVYGMGGSGKTTLAREVYNHSIVRQHFHCFAWVCISQQWQKRNLLQGILVSYRPDKRNEIEKWGDDEIVEHLVRVMNGKNCLVVLDDIWSIDAWECIKCAFPMGKKGNKILLTTRDKDVAVHIGPNGYHHKPRLLLTKDFVGFGDDAEKLVKALVNEDNTQGVVSVYGMGGSGKTTLAREVYNHPIVRQHFHSFAWVCISQQRQTRNLLQGILVSYLPGKRNEIEKWGDDEIVEQLVRVMNEKNCLVVLDDIWSIDAWECIKCAFPMGKKGNKLLLTTRKKNVAEHIGPNGYHHEPRLLTDAESLELLMKKAIRDQPHREDIQNLQALGKEMVKSCGGLPLAVVVLGGILATKHSYNEWEEVRKNIKSYLGKGERMDQNQGEVQRILALSYSDLPYKLKPCFLYLSRFPEDEEIDAKSLYGLWIAEGMVLAEDRMGEESMIEMADRYLGELAKRCLVTVKESEIYGHGRYNGCRLHDLLRDLCKAKAREEQFLECLDYGGGNHIELSNSVYSFGSYIPRIMISLGEKEAELQLLGSKHFRTLVVSAQERTDLMMGQILAKSQMKRFKMLRSLVLENVETPGAKNVKNRMGVYKLPVGKLIHLRLLRLRKSVLMMSPSSISNLEHLEILDLSGSSIRWTKKVPIKTRRLRYLDLDGSSSNFRMEIYMDDPNHLEVIYGYLGSPYKVNLSQLTNVRDLGCIYIAGVMKGSVDEIFECISKSRHLKHAQIWAGRSEVLRTTLVAQLFRSNVENISLNGLLGMLPEYDSHFLINLLSLQLTFSEIEEDPMKMLEKLPKLQRLEFCDEAFVAIGGEMVCHSGGFPQLRFLLFQKLISFETWTVEIGAMPNLSHLEIIRCRDLRMIPDALRFVTALKELEFRDMPDEFLERNIIKFRHVPSIVVNGSKLQSAGH